MKRITILLALCLSLGTSVSAQTSKSDLIGLGMAPELANEIVKGLMGTGTLANNTYINARNAANTADLSLIKADSSDNTVINSSANDYLILRLDDDANRLISFTAGTDTVLDMEFGDGSTANQTLDISARTADGADNGSVRISGGGAVDDPSRGAYLDLYGNENSGAGWALLGSGNASGADIRLDALDDLIFRFGANTTRVVTLDAAANDSLRMYWGDGGTTAAQAFSLVASTNDADDDSSLCVTAAGSSCEAIGTTNRGSKLVLYGNESPGTPGEAYLEANSVVRVRSATGAVQLRGSDVILAAANGTATWTANAAAGTLIGAGTGTIGWTVTTIQANTACSSRCTTPAVMGFGLTTDSAFPITGFFDGSSASSDICLCAGAS